MLGVLATEALSGLRFMGTPRALRLLRLGVVTFSVSSIEEIGTSLLSCPEEGRSTAVSVPDASETMGGVLLSEVETLTPF